MLAEQQWEKRYDYNNADECLKDMVDTPEPCYYLAQEILIQQYPKEISTKEIQEQALDLCDKIDNPEKFNTVIWYASIV